MHARKIYVGICVRPDPNNVASGIPANGSIKTVEIKLIINMPRNKQSSFEYLPLKQRSINPATSLEAMEGTRRIDGK